MTKSEIRKEILKKVKSQKSKVKSQKDRIIKEKILALPEFQKAKTLAFYMSLRGEVETAALIDEALAAGKRVVVPAIVGENLRLYGIKDRKACLAKGPYGVLQPDISGARPFPNDQIDLILVPGVAFTSDGARLGRGKGFYDRFLKTLSGRIKKVGLAYDFQILPDLPMTPHDMPVDIVITNEETLNSKH